MIRPAVSDDLGRIEVIERACFSDCWSAGNITAALTGPYDLCLVLEEAGEIAAFGILRIVSGEAEVQRIAVLPGLRRRGYARELLEHMVRASREKKAASIILEVRFSNHPARSLYGAYGFIEEGIRRGYYQNPPDDAVLMRMPLL